MHSVIIFFRHLWYFLHALNIMNAPICKFVACVAFISNISGYSCGRCPSVVAFTIDTRILMLLGAQVLIHVPIC